MKDDDNCMSGPAITRPTHSFLPACAGSIELQA